MNATYMQQWALARLYLAQGCDPDYRAADGRSVHDVLVERRADGLFDERDAPDDYRGLVAELESRGTSTRAR